MKSNKIAWLSLAGLAIVALFVGIFFIWRPLAPALSPVTGNIAELIEKAADTAEVGSRESVNLTDFPLSLPQGASIRVFAGKVENARLMAVDSQGVLYLSQTGSGKVVALPDKDKDGKADSIVEIISGLDRPHGLAFAAIGQSKKASNLNLENTAKQVELSDNFHAALLPMPEDAPDPEEPDTVAVDNSLADQEYLYIAETGRVIRLPRTGPMSFGKAEVIIDDLPPGGKHFTRSLAVSGEKLYVSTGSSCNVCVESEPHRATVWQYDLDGGNGRLFASGLRNAVGLALHPETGALWATENGRDRLGDKLPPDEINIVQADKNYGWPICYGANIHDSDFDKRQYFRDPCADMQAAHIDLPAHVAPLGLAFYQGNMFPELKGDLLVALHGSWNSSVPVGYKVARIDLAGDKLVSIEDFISGWLVTEKTANITSYSSLGRPVGVVIGSEGEIYISDDKAGVVYVVTNKQ